MQPLEAAVQARAKVGEVLARMGQLLSRIVMQNSGGKLGDAIPAATQLVQDGDSRRCAASSSRCSSRSRSVVTRDSARLTGRCASRWRACRS